RILDLFARRDPFICRHGLARAETGRFAHRPADRPEITCLGDQFAVRPLPHDRRVAVAVLVGRPTDLRVRLGAAGRWKNLLAPEVEIALAGIRRRPVGKEALVLRGNALALKERPGTCPLLFRASELLLEAGLIKRCLRDRP